MRAAVGWLVVWVLASGCGRRSNGVEDEIRGPYVTLYGVRLQTFKEAELFSVGRAAKVTYDRMSADFVASEVHYRMPGRGELTESGTRSDLEIRAAGARGNLNHQQVEAFDGVRLKNGPGLAAKTARAVYDGHSGTANGSDPVEVVGPDYTLHSKGFELNVAEEHFSFIGGVVSQLGCDAGVCDGGLP